MEEGKRESGGRGTGRGKVRWEGRRETVEKDKGESKERERGRERLEGESSLVTFFGVRNSCCAMLQKELLSRHLRTYSFCVHTRKMRKEVLYYLRNTKREDINAQNNKRKSLNMRRLFLGRRIIQKCRITLVENLMRRIVMNRSVVWKGCWINLTNEGEGCLFSLI